MHFLCLTVGDDVVISKTLHVADPKGGKMELAYFADEITKENFDEAVRQGVEAGATGIELRNGIWGKRIA